MKRFLLALFFAATASAQSFLFSPEAPVSEPRMGFPVAHFGDMKIASDGTNMLHEPAAAGAGTGGAMIGHRA